MDRLDSEYDKIFSKKMRAKLSRKPSAYMREGDNFWVSCELEERGLKNVIDAMGPDRIIYSSDFPHEPTEDSIAAAVPEFLAHTTYSDDVRRKNSSRQRGAALPHNGARDLPAGAGDAVGGRMRRSAFAMPGRKRLVLAAVVAGLAAAPAARAAEPIQIRQAYVAIVSNFASILLEKRELMSHYG